MDVLFDAVSMSSASINLSGLSTQIIAMYGMAIVHSVIASIDFWQEKPPGYLHTMNIFLRLPVEKRGHMILILTFFLSKRLF